MATDSWGITDAYDDARGERRATPTATRQAILAAMGADPADAGPPADAPVVVVAPGHGGAAVPPGDLSLEDGSRLRIEGSLPSDLPLGYHDLYPRGGGEPVRVVVCPRRTVRAVVAADDAGGRIAPAGSIDPAGTGSSAPRLRSRCA